MRRQAADEERRFWNEWNARYRGDDMPLPPPNRRQAEKVVQWLRQTDRGPRVIVEVGCGTGWLCGQLIPFGSVVGIDMADIALQAARARQGAVTFIAGDFMAMALTPASADVVVTLETLAHVADQSKFVERLALLLRDDGLLLLATQNRFVMERMNDMAPPGPGQVRQWVTATQLRSLLLQRFEILELTSLHPTGHRGILRVVNSVKLGRLLDRLGLGHLLCSLKERWLLGHTLIARCRKRPVSEIRGRADQGEHRKSGAG
jgi:2-polyprenyl-3-methyl-5-hydroxy-6-metoxy-1,4-benzoquinol methylase